MPSLRNHMHHKFAVVDAHTVVSGSFNWSVNAIKSFENIIVMSDAAEQAVKFLAEFDKLWKLDTPAIKTLQSRLRCRRGNCTGQQYNMLVFSSAHSKYYELTGDLIEVCGHCMHYTTLQHCIEDNQLILLFEDYRASPDEDTAVLDMIIQNHLNSYIKNSIVIHALARVDQDLDYGGNDELNTVVLWKNKFVGDGLPSSFPEVNFGVAYDNTSSF